MTLEQCIASFPAMFKLRNFQGAFRVSARRSFVRDDGSFALYLEREDESLGWVPFGKGSPGELRAQMRGES